MSRIERCFEALGVAGRKALIPYVTAGDPQPTFTVPLMHAMVLAGANILEVGVPFSDPMADGPVIQRAGERALRHHVNLARVLDMVREFRERDQDTPIVLMGYSNPMEAMGYAEFAERAARAGVDGVLTVDLPPEEAETLVSTLDRCGIAPIFLIAPTTVPDRIAHICAAARGFVYCVSLKGVTGAAHLDIAAVTDQIQRVRAITNLPVGVGFGIRDARSAARVAQVADAVVIGSAIVRQIEEYGEPSASQAVEGFLKEIRESMDRVMI